MPLAVILDIDGTLVDSAATRSDVEATKPNPDLIRAALERAGIGLIVAVLTGGISEGELRESGAAAAAYESVAELCRRLDETPLGVRAG